MRVLILGLPGSGKTTLAAALARTFDLEHVEVDRLFWSRDPLDTETLASSLEQRLVRPSWVVEGHFSKVEAVVVPRAQFCLWLDYPFAQIWWRGYLRKLGSVLGLRRNTWDRGKALSGSERRQRRAMFAAALTQVEARGGKVLRLTSSWRSLESATRFLRQHSASST